MSDREIFGRMVIRIRIWHSAMPTEPVGESVLEITTVRITQEESSVRPGEAGVVIAVSKTGVVVSASLEDKLVGRRVWSRLDGLQESRERVEGDKDAREWIKGGAHGTRCRSDIT
jgi:hypothetical protein